MSPESLKMRLEELLKAELSAELALAASLSTQERTIESSYEHWSVKDALGHAAVWKLRGAQELLARLGGKEVPHEEELEVSNRAIFDECQHRSWESMQELVHQAHSEMLVVLETCPEEDLEKEFGGKALAREVIGAGVWHPIVHLAYAEVERGQPDRAVELIDMLGQRVLGVDGSWAMRRIVTYDRACIAARAALSHRCSP